MIKTIREVGQKGKLNFMLNLRPEGEDNAMSLFSSVFQNMVRKFIRKEYWRNVRQGRAKKKVYRMWGHDHACVSCSGYVLLCKCKNPGICPQCGALGEQWKDPTNN